MSVRRKRISPSSLCGIVCNSRFSSNFPAPLRAGNITGNESTGTRSPKGDVPRAERRSTYHDAGDKDAQEASFLPLRGLHVSAPLLATCIAVSSFRKL
uniref:Uncharacterized protein n=1 Tax=Steinernema glaseri TaxID=37863 RepID=A0A1I7YFF3_9BILA